MGILIITASDPHMNAILKIDGAVGTSENANIEVASIDQCKILYDLFQASCFLPVEFKDHHVVFHARDPGKLDGLLMAGRCISATHVAASAGKSMGNCVATGHAAGLAAAMSVKKRCLPRELKVGQLQDALRADGVDLTRGGESQDELDNQG